MFLNIDALIQDLSFKIMGQMYINIMHPNSLVLAIVFLRFFKIELINEWFIAESMAETIDLWAENYYVDGKKSKLIRRLWK